MARKSKKARNGTQPTENNIFELRNITPKTQTQKVVFNEYNKGKSLFLHGYAGTGKSFVSLYLALKEVFSNSVYKKILIVRSAVPSRDQGFLPGNTEEKARIYEEPYKYICDDLFGRGDGYKILKLKKLVEFTTTSFLRGLTFDDTIIIVDEVQNMSFAELHTVMTRVGENSKIIFSGDFRQTDLQRESDKKGLFRFMKILKSMDDFSFIEFQENDIVRGNLVKHYIIQEAKLSDTENRSSQEVRF